MGFSCLKPHLFFVVIVVIFGYFVCFRIFLLKQIVRKYGLDALKKIIEIRNLSWILPENMRQAEVNYYLINKKIARYVVTS